MSAFLFVDDLFCMVHSGHSVAFGSRHIGSNCYMSVTSFLCFLVRVSGACEQRNHAHLTSFLPQPFALGVVFLIVDSLADSFVLLLWIFAKGQFPSGKIWLNLRICIIDSLAEEFDTIP